MWRVYKRGKVWWATKTVKGVRVRSSTGCASKAAATKVTERWELEDVSPQHRAANETTLESALSALMTDRRTRGRADGTISMYEQKSAHLLRLLGASVKLSAVTAHAVDTYCATRLEEGAHRSTIGKELTTLRAALRLARRHGLFDRDVAEVLPIGWSADYEPRTTFLDTEQVKALLREVARDTSTRKEDLSDRAGHVAFIVATAARWSESLRARPVDIDVVGGAVRLRGTKTEKSAATIPVPDGPSKELLTLALALMPASGFRPWGSVTRDLENACRRAGVPRVTPNDLRRTAATWLVQRGVSLHAVSKVLRHADTRMVERVYGQLPSDDLRRMLVGVPVLCQTGQDSADRHVRSDTESAEKQCPGAESNRRHADFQSTTLQPVCAVIGAVPTSLVTVLCQGPEVDTFGELLDLALSVEPPRQPRTR